MNPRPMVCPNCGLPTVPFGGEDICMGTDEGCRDEDEREREAYEEEDYCDEGW